MGEMSLVPIRKIHFRLAIMVGLIAFCIRVLFVITYPASPLAGGDQPAFWSYAQGIASGNGFRSDFEPWLADRPPLYSYFLAGIFKCFGEDKLTVFIVQAIIGSVAASIFYLCAVRLLGDRRGFAAGIMFSLMPHFLLFTKQILTEALYIPLLVLLLAIIILPERKSRFIGYWIFPGILLGLIGLVRREALLPGGLILILATVLYNRLEKLRVAAVLLVVAAGVGVSLAPWMLRNWGALGKPMLSSSSGWNFMVGNNPNGTGSYSPPPDEWTMKFKGLDELARDQMAWELSLGWIQSNPMDFLALIPKKLAALFMPAHNLVLDLADVGLIILSILGVIRIVQKQDSWKWLAAIALSLLGSAILVALVFVGGWRYRMVIYPGIFLLSAFGVPESWLRLLDPMFLRLRLVHASA
jgi:4-amino-4-deoxy-L-arabinose transferase-like glycosyltransferase